jgi:hypothetical protein
VPPPTVHLFGTPFITWRGVPLIPSNKLEVKNNSTSILLLRVGEAEQGVVGLQKPASPAKWNPACPSATWARTKFHRVASRHALLLRQRADHRCHRPPG